MGVVNEQSRRISFEAIATVSLLARDASLPARSAQRPRRIKRAGIVERRGMMTLMKGGWKRRVYVGTRPPSGWLLLRLPTYYCSLC
jgi:hypothetical protein